MRVIITTSIKYVKALYIRRYSVSLQFSVHRKWNEYIARGSIAEWSVRFTEDCRHIDFVVDSSSMGWNGVYGMLLYEIPWYWVQSVLIIQSQVSSPESILCCVFSHRDWRDFSRKSNCGSAFLDVNCFSYVCTPLTNCPFDKINFSLIYQVTLLIIRNLT